MGIIEYLQYGFVLRGLAAGLLTGVALSLLGVFLVLRRLSLLGDGMSHVALSGIALGLAMNANPLYIAVPVTAASSLAIARLTVGTGLHGDAAIGMVSALGLSAAAVIASLSGGFNADLMGYLFGSILSVGPHDLAWSAALFAATGAGIFLFRRELACMAFDEHYAAVAGFGSHTLNQAFVVLTGTAVVIAARITGALLVSAMLIIPPASALMLARSFRQTLWLSAAVSALAVLAGAALSFTLNIPTGASIVLCALALFCVCYIIKAGRSRT